ncbi:hypothetical protein [Arthrobacter sp. UYCu723]
MTTFLKTSDGTELLNVAHIKSFKIDHREGYSPDADREQKRSAIALPVRRMPPHPGPGRRTSFQEGADASFLAGVLEQCQM